MKTPKMKTTKFAPVLLAPLTALLLLPTQAMGADDKPVIPAFPVAKSAAALNKQVQDYDQHLRLAQAASMKASDLAFAKDDVE